MNIKYQTVLVFALLTCAVSACTPGTTRPQAVIATACKPSDDYLIERCAESIGDVYEVYQRRALELVSDPSTPGDLKRQLQSLDRELTPAVRVLVQTSQAYVQLKTAQSPEAAAKEADLRAKLADVQPRVESLPPI